jgi:hypothetical protein
LGDSETVVGCKKEGECDWPYVRDRYLQNNEVRQLRVSFTGLTVGMSVESLLRVANQHYRESNLSFVVGATEDKPMDAMLVSLENENSTSYECQPNHTKKDTNEFERLCIGVEEFVENNTPMHKSDLVVHIVDFADPAWLGYAYPPWWHDVALRGHVFLAARAAWVHTAHESTFSHEVGHSLGLYHVFDTDTDQRECNSCNELVGDPAHVRDHRGECPLFTSQLAPTDFSSFCIQHRTTPGDFCSDTPPISSRLSRTQSCMSAPTFDKCSNRRFDKLPNTNLMSYSPASCKEGDGSGGFTPQQIARMRCWLATAPPHWTHRPRRLPVAPLRTAVYQQVAKPHTSAVGGTQAQGQGQPTGRGWVVRMRGATI